MVVQFSLEIVGLHVGVGKILKRLWPRELSSCQSLCPEQFLEEEPLLRVYSHWGPSGTFSGSLFVAMALGAHKVTKVGRNGTYFFIFPGCFCIKASH